MILQNPSSRSLSHCIYIRGRRVFQSLSVTHNPSLWISIHRFNWFKLVAFFPASQKELFDGTHVEHAERSQVRRDWDDLCLLIFKQILRSSGRGGPVAASERVRPRRQNVTVRKEKVRGPAARLFAIPARGIQSQVTSRVNFWMHPHSYDVHLLFSAVYVHLCIHINLSKWMFIQLYIPKASKDCCWQAKVTACTELFQTASLRNSNSKKSSFTAFLHAQVFFSLPVTRRDPPCLTAFISPSQGFTRVHLQRSGGKNGRQTHPKTLLVSASPALCPHRRKGSLPPQARRA